MEASDSGDGKKAKGTCLHWRPGEGVEEEAVRLACCSAGQEQGCSGGHVRHIWSWLCGKDLLSDLLHLLLSLFPFISHTTKIYFKNVCSTKSTDKVYFLFVLPWCRSCCLLIPWQVRSDEQDQGSKTALDLGSQYCTHCGIVEKQLQQRARPEAHKVCQELFIRWHTPNCKAWPHLLSQSEPIFLVCLDHKIAEVVVLHHKWLA